MPSSCCPRAALPPTSSALRALPARPARSRSPSSAPHESELGRLADHEVVAVVGPEVIAGSTRMKAGTAQKLVLNTISTVSMVRLGKTYGNLMVDVVASNAKLRNRARSAVVIATGAAEAEVDAALESSDGDAKVAIVSLLSGLDAAGARTRLDAAGGVVRRALEPDVAQ